jgi:hypothetical protein
MSEIDIKRGHTQKPWSEVQLKLNPKRRFESVTLPKQSQSECLLAACSRFALAFLQPCWSSRDNPESHEEIDFKSAKTEINQ